jgi:Flp pilus assembly protein TadB
MVTSKNLLTLFLLFVLATGTANALVAVAGNRLPEEQRNELTEEQKARLEVLKNRIEQIKAMDRSTLRKAERKNLRQELRAIKKEARDMSTKSFVLVLGAMVIAILLLILLL